MISAHLRHILDIDLLDTEPDLEIGNIITDFEFCVIYFIKPTLTCNLYYLYHR